MALTDRLEIPPEMRAFAEKSVEQAKQAFDGFLLAAHNAVNAFEGQAETARKGAKDVTEQAMSFHRAEYRQLIRVRAAADARQGRPGHVPDAGGFHQDPDAGLHRAGQGSRREHQ
jgi:hypothetical protein